MDIGILSLFLFLCVTIFLICRNKRDNDNNLSVEHYDASIEDITLEKCALSCKISKDCKGFGYNKSKNICYPSKNKLEGKILGKLYSSKYKKNNIRCNKFSEANINKEVPGEYDRRNNSLFICTKNDFSNEHMYYHYNNKLAKVLKPSSFDQIKNIDYYKMNDFTWPSNKFERKITKNETDDNIKDYLEKNNEENKKKEKIYQEESVEKIVEEIEIKKEKEKEREKSTNTQHIIKKSNYYPSNIYEISPLINTTDNLYKYGCVDDINLNECLKGCSKDSKCKGVEWNPLYLKLLKNNIYKQYRNVCCLKNNMNTLNKRDISFELGNSYIKRPQIDSDKKYHVF